MKTPKLPTIATVKAAPKQAAINTARATTHKPVPLVAPKVNTEMGKLGMAGAAVGAGMQYSGDKKQGYTKKQAGAVAGASSAMGYGQFKVNQTMKAAHHAEAHRVGMAAVGSSAEGKAAIHAATGTVGQTAEKGLVRGGEIAGRSGAAKVFQGAARPVLAKGLGKRAGVGAALMIGSAVATGAMHQHFKKKNAAAGHPIHPIAGTSSTPRGGRTTNKHPSGHAH